MNLSFSTVAPSDDYLLEQYPDLSDVPMVGTLPGIILVVSLVLTLINEGTTLVKMWLHAQRQPMPQPT